MRVKALFCLAFVLVLTVGKVEGQEAELHPKSASTPILAGVTHPDVVPDANPKHSTRNGYAAEHRAEESHIWPVELIRRIPGPKFFLLFACLLAVCILASWLLANADGTDVYPLPEITHLDPFAAAALRGGCVAVVQTVVLSMWNKDLIKLKTKGQWDSRDDVEAEAEGVQESLLSPIEAEVLDFLQTFRKPSELLKSLRPRLKQHLKPVYAELAELHLIQTRKHQTSMWLTTMAAVSIILMVGSTKLYLGTIYKKPVGFLVLLLPGALLALFVIVKPWKRLTTLGHRYLKMLQKEFGWMQNATELERNPEGIDPAFCVAVFGAGVLAGVPVFGAFSEIFQPATGIWDGFFCGGGCGGGCGGCGG